MNIQSIVVAGAGTMGSSMAQIFAKYHDHDVAGFAANRLQFAVLREALDLVQKGVISKEGIDEVMKYGLGFRYACLGPLEVSDFGGLDTFYHISSYLMKDLCDAKTVPELMKQHYEAGSMASKPARDFMTIPEIEHSRRPKSAMRSF